MNVITLSQSLFSSDQLRRTVSLFSLLSVCIVAETYGQRTQNYTRKEVIQVRNILTDQSVSDLSNATDKAVVYEYVDELNRPLQTVALKASQGQHDVVQPIIYDSQGRQSQQYLPYAMGTDGALRTNWAQEQTNFYQQSAKVARDIRLFNESSFEQSPLNRVVEQAAPGWSWQPSRGATKKSNNRTNVANEVRECTLVSGVASSSSTYSIGALSAMETTDEQGQKTTTFHDSRGLLVCRLLSSTSGTTLTTYYIYNEGGQLVLTLPPECVKRWSNTSFGALSAPLLESYAFQYEYDEQSRLIGKKVPGSAWEYLIYDRWDRVVLKQDGNMRRATPYQWEFVKYDSNNRPILTGLFAPVTTDRTQLRAEVAAATVRFESRNTQAEGYSLNQTYPTGATAAQLRMMTYFDDYAYPALTSTYAFVAQIGNAAAGQNTVGMATATRARGLADQQWYTTVTYYDAYQRVIQVVADNVFNIATPSRLTKAYDFAGRELQSMESTTINGAFRTMLRTNTLDHQGRVTGIVCSVDGETPVTVATNEYNELGQLVDKKLHKVGNTYLQSLDYRHNIRGWLTQLNNRDLTESSVWMSIGDPNEDSDALQDLFGMELNYDGVDARGTMLMGLAAPSYNGNVVEQVWRSATDNQLRGYTYLYDGFNRITDALYRGWSPTDSWNTTERDNFTTSGIGYDDNGNIASMSRNGLANSSPKYRTYGPIDQLGYAYAGNQLTTVNEALPTTDVRRKTDLRVSTNFTYDPNGNVERDSGKGMSVIYNYLNLPQTVRFDAGARIEFEYTASGQRLAKRVFSASSLLVSSVATAGSFTFQTGPDRLYVATPEGRALFEPNRTSAPEKWLYEYHIKDHLGNLRLAFRDNGTDVYRASFEQANEEEENKHFGKLASVRQLDAAHAQSGQYAARLNAGQVNRREGAVATISVQRGDSVTLEVFGLYESKKSVAHFPWLGAAVPVGNLAPEIAQRDGKISRNNKVFLGAGIAIIPQLLASQQEKQPAAALHYEYYTRDSVLVTSKDISLSSHAVGGWEKLQGSFKADSAGYVRVSLQNTSPTDVWFDNAAIGVKPSMIVQENHYDPWGLNLTGIERYGYPEDFKLQYNSKERIDEYGLNWTDYGARMYDAQLGRWHSVDPHAENYVNISPYAYVDNNPVNNIDPDGRDIIYKSSSVTNKLTGITTITVTTSVSMKLLNNSSLSTSDFNSRVNEFQKELASSLTGSNKVGNTLYVFKNGKMNIQAASSMKEVSPTDHLMVFVDDVTRNSLEGTRTLGMADIKGKVSYIESGEGTGNMIHEFGHNMGLLHNWTTGDPNDNNKGNYMSYEADKSSFSGSQLMISYLLGEQGALNKRNNSSSATNPAPGLSTQRHPYQKAYEGEIIPRPLYD